MSNNEKFFGMGNDYMFHAVLQESEKVLRHLVASMLNLSDEDIYSCELLNPIELGKSIDAKDCILIHV